MEQRLSIITLGTKNITEARHFYEKGLGWKIAPISTENICFIQMNGIALALYSKNALREDACLQSEFSELGFGGITLAYNTRTREEVPQFLTQAKKAGGTILKPAQEAFWGGYSGYFADLDGYPWEVAWNPYFVLDAQGNIKL